MGLLNPRLRAHAKQSDHASQGTTMPSPVQEFGPLSQILRNAIPLSGNRIGGPGMVAEFIRVGGSAGCPPGKPLSEYVSGASKYEGKRPGPGAQFAACVAYDGKILLTSEDGDTHVIQAGPEFAVLRTNSVGEPVLASPAIANGMIFIRGRDHLFAIAQ
jgi:outer membrane protein assembly factor BamB